MIKIGNYNFKVYKTANIFVVLFLLLSFFFLAVNSKFLFFVFFFKFLFSLIMFRDEERIEIAKNVHYVSPTDGKIIKIEKSKLSYLDNNEQEFHKVTVFLDPYTSRVQRIPVDSMVKDIFYFPGKFFNFFTKEYLKESNLIILEGINNNIYAIYQTSNFFSKMIDCELKKDEAVPIGHKFGLLKMSDIVELYIPSKFKLEIKEGQNIIGGETVFILKDKK